MTTFHQLIKYYAKDSYSFSIEEHKKFVEL